MFLLLKLVQHTLTLFIIDGSRINLRVKTGEQSFVTSPKQILNLGAFKMSSFPKPYPQQTDSQLLPATPCSPFRFSSSRSPLTAIKTLYCSSNRTWSRAESGQPSCGRAWVVLQAGLEGAGNNSPPINYTLMSRQPIRVEPALCSQGEVAGEGEFGEWQILRGGTRGEETDACFNIKQCLFFTAVVFLQNLQLLDRF